MHKNGCADRRADKHTEDASDFGEDVKDANEKVDVDNGLDSVREGIAVGLLVIVGMKLEVVVIGFMFVSVGCLDRDGKTSARCDCEKTGRQLCRQRCHTSLRV